MKMTEAKLAQSKLPGRVLPFTGAIGWLDRILAKARSMAAGSERHLRPPSLRLAGRLSLGGAKTLFVVEFEALRFLVAASADRVNCIHAIPTTTSVGSASGEASRSNV